MPVDPTKSSTPPSSSPEPPPSSEQTSSKKGGVLRRLFGRGPNPTKIPPNATLSGETEGKSAKPESASPPAAKPQNPAAPSSSRAHLGHPDPNSAEFLEWMKNPQNARNYYASTASTSSTPPVRTAAASSAQPPPQNISREDRLSEEEFAQLLRKLEAEAAATTNPAPATAHRPPPSAPAASQGTAAHSPSGTSAVAKPFSPLHQRDLEAINSALEKTHVPTTQECFRRFSTMEQSDEDIREQKQNLLSLYQQKEIDAYEYHSQIATIEARCTQPGYAQRKEVSDRIRQREKGLETVGRALLTSPEDKQALISIFAEKEQPGLRITLAPLQQSLFLRASGKTDNCTFISLANAVTFQAIHASSYTQDRDNFIAHLSSIQNEFAQKLASCSPKEKQALNVLWQQFTECSDNVIANLATADSFNDCIHSLAKTNREQPNLASLLHKYIRMSSSLYFILNYDAILANNEGLLLNIAGEISPGNINIAKDALVPYLIKKAQGSGSAKYWGTAADVCATAELFKMRLTYVDASRSTPTSFDAGTQFAAQSAAFIINTSQVHSNLLLSTGTVAAHTPSSQGARPAASRMPAQPAAETWNPFSPQVATQRPRFSGDNAWMNELSEKELQALQAQGAFETPPSIPPRAAPLPSAPTRAPIVTPSASAQPAEAAWNPFATPTAAPPPRASARPTAAQTPPKSRDLQTMFTCLQSSGLSMSTTNPNSAITKAGLFHNARDWETQWLSKEWASPTSKMRQSINQVLADNPTLTHALYLGSSGTGDCVFQSLGVGVLTAFPGSPAEKIHILQQHLQDIQTQLTQPIDDSSIVDAQKTRFRTSVTAITQEFIRQSQNMTRLLNSLKEKCVGASPFTPFIDEMMKREEFSNHFHRYLRAASNLYLSRNIETIDPYIYNNIEGEALLVEGGVLSLLQQRAAFTPTKSIRPGEEQMLGSLPDAYALAHLFGARIAWLDIQPTTGLTHNFVYGPKEATSPNFCIFNREGRHADALITAEPFKVRPELLPQMEFVGEARRSLTW